MTGEPPATTFESEPARREGLVRGSLPLRSMNDSKSRASTASTEQVPKAVVSRLSLYLRELQRLIHDGVETISSTHLGQLLDLTDAQVRKDLAYFGQFGYPGRGYRCQELVSAIRGILGTDRDWPVAIVGIGNLGRALLRYKGFSRQGFRIVAAFDCDLTKVDQMVDGVAVYHLDQLSEVARREGIRLGLIAVPTDSAQTVADRLVDAGVDGIMNFAPVTIALPVGVSKVAVDLAIELEQLTFAVANRGQNS